MSIFAEYLASIKRELTGGSATENSYRPALKALLEASEQGISATNEPKRTDCGAPDFSIKRKNVLLGYLETKDIGTNLDEMEHGKAPYGGQFARYSDGLPNWILTDYLEFRWFVKGKKQLVARLAELDAKGKIKPTQDGEQKLAQLLNAFFKEPALTVSTAKDLAASMAQMTRIVRDQIIESLKQEVEETERRRLKEASGYSSALHTRRPWLHEWLAAFREVLIPDLNETQFADMFAQTLSYGLFAARVHAPSDKEFSREVTASKLPKTNPFLRKLFREIAGDIPESIAWAVDDIVELLKHSDMSEILKDFGKGKGKEDPVVHFYETFLAAYDPKMRELRGVYYTPEPVVSFIVRSIDYLLTTHFERPKGLADENTLILDPATGTATFLYFVIDLIHQGFSKQKGSWDDYVAEHLLNRMFGFELLMAPYAIAHLKLGMQLEQTGYKFGSDQRLGIYLTNTLEEAAKKSEQLFASWVAEEANAASRIKRDEPILVVLGNPPYSNFGRMNRGKWILSLLDDYKRDLHEKKLNIDDDFIKFIRFAQWRIEKTGYGIIALITNNTYIDGITHRRMRECLLNTFNEIYILNLHGNLRKKETSPDGSEDINVFDIQQGVAISMFIKTPNAKDCQVFYSDLWGKRELKYSVLRSQDVAKIKWIEIKSVKPNYFFVPKDIGLEDEYKQGINLKNMFLHSGNGIKTERDRVSIHFTEDMIRQVVDDFRSLEDAQLRAKYDLDVDSRDWKISKAKADVIEHSSDDYFRPILYRPFDRRHTWYSGQSRGFIGTPGFPIMKHMLANDNLAMLACRQQASVGFQHVYCSRQLTECCAVSLRTREITSVFPLYLDPKTDGELDLDKGGRRPNITPTFLKALAEKLKLPQEEQHRLPKDITPEDIFHYTYAVFHSPTYRTRYSEFLKIDFPRLPLTIDLQLFRALATRGSELVALHLLESPRLLEFITEFPEKGDNIVEKVQYTDEDKRVWINKIQYFGGVPKGVWELHIGGYQVCEKWLKDRKGRKLSYDDIQHYQKIVMALSETIRIMTEIDEVIDKHGGWPGAFSFSA